MRSTAGLVHLPERTEELCLAQQLVAEVQALVIERDELTVEAARAREAGRAKLSEGAAPPRVTEIDARLDELYDEMAEYTGQVVLRAEPAGAWRRWADEHPARELGRDEQGRPQFHPQDASVTGGWCDSTALLERLGDFVVSWNGDPVSAEDWSWVMANAAPGDLKRLCTVVMEMHERAGAGAPKSRRPSSGMPMAESDSDSPETSE